MKELAEELMRAYPDLTEGWAHHAQVSRDVPDVEPQALPPEGGLEPEEREHFLASHSRLHQVCRHTLADIHRNFTDLKDVLALTDAEGRLICLHCSPVVLSTATGDLGLRCGVTLTEASCGTNAITQALRYREAMVSVRPAPRRVPFGNRATVAVPMLDSCQNVVGCIAIFSAGEGSLGEKLLLAKFIAREISRVHFLYAAGPTAAAPLASSQGALDDAGQYRLAEVAEVAETLPPGLVERRRGDRRRMQGGSAVSSVKLTQRQLQVLQLFAQGKGYKEIAREIGITSYKTVEEHLDAVREKLQVAHRRECIQKAMSLGLL